jgi:hypothetical protein
MVYFQLIYRNSRQTAGLGSKQSTPNGSKYANWAYKFNKNSLGATSCGNCYFCEGIGWRPNNTNLSNGCEWQCALYTSTPTYAYCSGTLPV